MTTTYSFGQDQDPFDSRVEQRFSYRVVGIEFEGVHRTNKEWLTEYLGIPLPANVTAEEATLLETKLTTTLAFVTAEIRFRPLEIDPSSHVMVVSVEEKWTLIPVVRGVYGGGTPLLVAGVYDIHATGRLWTIGAEARKYGDASPGYVLYFRDPRHAGGRFYLGAEAWKMRRIRPLYDAQGETQGSIESEEEIVRANVLFPMRSQSGSDGKFAWKYGFDVRWRRIHPQIVHDLELDENELKLGTSHRESTELLPTLWYDDIDVRGLGMNGIRGELKSGPLVRGEELHSLTTFEFYYYRLFTRRLNLGLHLETRSSSSDRYDDYTFVGGLDSVRGLPDGFIAGSRAGYLNLEARTLLAEFKYAWIQSVIFHDIGVAGNSWDGIQESQRSSVGGGVRVAIPQVHRLMFRIDYAMSVDGSGTRGITAGLNHFFDPYVPL